MIASTQVPSAPTRPVRVLIVDDSMVQRSFLRQVLLSEPDIEVVSSAPNGRLALPRVRHYTPDLILLDQEMPELDGLETLALIRAGFPQARVIMYCTETQASARVTVQALQRGALDFVTKPRQGAAEDPTAYVRRVLVPRIRALCPQPAQSDTHRPAAVPAALRGHYTLCAIGISTGGPEALAQLIALLPARLRGPIVIAQHMPPVFTRQLAESLNQLSAASVMEAQDGDRLEAGTIWIAPGGRHLLVERSGRDFVARVRADAPELLCRPSADRLFQSVAQAAGGGGIGVIMTGMGDDGYEGLRSMSAAGAYLIGQSASSCVVYGMPARPAAEGLTRESLHVAEIAERITTLLGADDVA